MSSCPRTDDSEIPEPSGGAVMMSSAGSSKCDAELESESESSTSGQSSGTSRDSCSTDRECSECQDEDTDPTDPFIALWTDLHPTLVGVLRMEPLNRKEYLRLNTEVYSFCTAIDIPAENDPSGYRGLRTISFITSGNRVLALYANLRDLLTEHLDEIFQKMNVYHGDALLEQYCAGWKDFRFSSQVISGIFEYLSRPHFRDELVKHSEEITVNKTCMKHWKARLLEPLEPQVMRAVLDMYAADRNGEVINSQLLHGIINDFVALGIAIHEPDAGLKLYQAVFEEKFLEETKAYYVSESSLFLQNNSVSDYIKKVHTRLAQENDRGPPSTCTNPHCGFVQVLGGPDSTSPALYKLLEEALIIPHDNILDKNEFTDFLTHEKVQGEGDFLTHEKVQGNS